MAKIHQLVRCRMIDKPEFALMMREQDIDPSKHERVPEGEEQGEGQDAATPKAPEAPKEPDNDDGLLTLTMKALRELPEYALIEKPANTKADLVAQIRGVRDHTPEVAEPPPDEPAPAQDLERAEMLDQARADDGAQDERVPEGEEQLEAPPAE